MKMQSHFVSAWLHHLIGRGIQHLDMMLTGSRWRLSRCGICDHVWEQRRAAEEGRGR